MLENEYLWSKGLTFTRQQNFALTKSKDDKYADEKYNVAKMMNSFFYRLENILRKGENTDYLHSLLFPQDFQTRTLRLIKMAESSPNR